MNIEIAPVDWHTQAATMLAIRFAVFVDEQGVPADLEQDIHDPGALHVLARTRSGEPIGTARLLDDGRIGRMAVLPPWRGKGVGSALLQTLMQIAADRGDRTLFLHAQCTAIPFYERAGFVAAGDVFDDAGIAHRLMHRELTTLST